VRVLFLTPVPPWPLTSGGRIRTYQLLKHAARSAEVHLRFVHDGTPTAALERELDGACASCVGFERSTPDRVKRVTRSKFERWFHSHELELDLRSELERAAYDLIHVDELASLQAVETTDTPLIVHHHKLDREFARASGHSSWDVTKLALLEKRAVQRSSQHVFCSEEDAARFRARHPNIRAHVIPNGVDIDDFRLSAAVRREQHFVFVGSLDYAPNIEGLDWFFDQVWPRLEDTGATLSIVGARPRRSAQAWGRMRGVEVIGPVDHVQPCLSDATALLVPLLTGGGSRLKIVEALATGCPVLSTSVGAEGLGLEPGAHLEVADTADAWEAKLRAAPTQSGAWREMALVARAEIVQRLQWSTLAQRLVSAWSSALV